ncbi:putative NTF2-like domain superfamily protein [Helianthus debilis subsp. tardiflorus]
MAAAVVLLLHPPAIPSFQFKFLPSSVTPKYTSRSRRRSRRLKVSSRIKDLEPTVEEEEEKKQNYYVNTGSAIRTLREDLPDLFHRDLTFHIYRDDTVFKDPLNSFFGIENYKSIFWALRFTGRIFFKALWVDIISVWQPVETTIMIRWTVHGIPRLALERRTRFDATSEYKLDKRGKIYERRVHDIILNAPPSKISGFIGNPIFWVPKGHILF